MFNVQAGLGRQKRGTGTRIDCTDPTHPAPGVGGVVAGRPSGMTQKDAWEYDSWVSRLVVSKHLTTHYTYVLHVRRGSPVRYMYLRAYVIPKPNRSHSAVSVGGPLAQ